MSIATQIKALQTDKSNIRNAILNKGGTCPSGNGFDDFATGINSIPEKEIVSLTIPEDLLANPINFIDSDGNFQCADREGSYSVIKNSMGYYGSDFENEIDWNPSSAITVVSRGTYETLFRINSSCTISYACFTQGTQITMADSSSKAIEDIIVGDKLLGYDGNKYIPVEVLKTFRHNYTGKIYKIVYNNGYIEATWNHPIYIDGDYKLIKDLQIGDHVFTNGENDPIINIECADVENIIVYNLDVDNTNNYVANSCLVHNKPI